jgi:predicted O-methyltransferase YrrM
MYSSFTLAQKYFRYYLNASNGKGHGVHSPFVYDFICNVLNAKNVNPFYNQIEALRNNLLKDKTLLTVWDKGAGSRHQKTNQRSIQQIAKAALKPAKYSSLLGRMVAYYQTTSILEMGTSLGITTSYLAASNPQCFVTTMEGAPAVAAIAKNNFQQLHIENILLLKGDFDQTLPAYLSGVTNLSMVYVDGNHQFEPTMQYFEKLVEHADDTTIFIFDDIHWSAGMEKAWEAIKKDARVTLTIDLFFIGIVFFRKAQQEKEHFIIRY